MKIIVLGTRGFPNIQGGVEKHCEELYPRLVDLGCQVTVIGRAPYIGKEPYQYKGITILPLACPRNKFLEAFVHTFLGVFKARKMGCDILHIHAIGPSLFIPMARFLGLKVVMTHHGPDYERKKWNWMAKMVLVMGECKGCICANEIIAISKAIVDHIKKCYWRTANQIPNGVVIPQQINSIEALKRFELEQGKYILTVGRFVPEKGFDDLMDAFRLVGDPSLEQYKLVIVGDADHADEYSTKLKERANQVKGIVLTGRLTGLPLQELYAHAGMFVLPSYYEGLPIVLLEAMSYGLSCVASDIPANKETGLRQERFFKVGNVDALASKIREFVQNPISDIERTQQVELINRQNNWQTIAQMTFGVYRKICKRG